MSDSEAPGVSVTFTPGEVRALVLAAGQVEQDDLGPVLFSALTLALGRLADAAMRQGIEFL